MTKPFGEKLERLLEKEPEHFGERKQDPTSFKVVVVAFAQYVPLYAQSNQHKYENWATGIIRYAHDAKSWPHLRHLVHENIISRSSSRKPYHAPDFTDYIPHFEENMLRLLDSTTPGDRAFFALFVAAMRDQDDDPDKLMHSYFKGGR